LFFQAYSWCHEIDAFHREAEKVKIRNAKFNYAEIYAVMDVALTSDNYKAKLFDFNIGYEFHVNGEITDEERQNMPEWYEGRESQNYGVSLTPVGEYSSVPLRLCKEIVIQEYRSDLRKTISYVECQRDLTLMEILDAIYWEVSFHGGPEQAASFLDELQQNIEEVKSGKVETIPLEDIKKELMENQLEEDEEE
jgi:hypothetical protein